MKPWFIVHHHSLLQQVDLFLLVLLLVLPQDPLLAPLSGLPEPDQRLGSTGVVGAVSLAVSGEVAGVALPTRPSTEGTPLDLPSAVTSSTSLEVVLSTSPSSWVFSGELVTILATVTLNGTPVPNASVSFSDSLGDTFFPSTSLAGGSGTALSNLTAPTVDLPTNDTLFAIASASGSGSAAGSIVLSIRPSGPRVSSFVATPSVVPVGHTSYLNVSATDNNGNLSFAYSGLPSGCSSLDTPFLRCSPSSGGAYHVQVYVNDSQARSVTATTNLTAYFLPSIDRFLASPAAIPLGHSTYLNTTSRGGFGTLRLEYTGLPQGCVSSDVSSLPCTPTVAGSFTLRVYANDTAGNSASATAQLLVGSVPSVSSFVISPSFVEVNSSAYLNVSATGGTGPLSFAFTGVPPGCLSANSSSLVCRPTGSGVYPVRVFVNDSLGDTANATANLTSYYPLTILSFIDTPDPVSVGSSVQVAVQVTGGIAPYAFSYSGLPPGCSSSENASLSCHPTQLGSYLLRVTVSDSLGDMGSSVANLTVTSFPIISSFLIAPSFVPVGHATDLNVTVNGGIPPLDYVYLGLPAGCATSDLAEMDCTPLAPGSYTVNVVVNDILGHSVNASSRLTVFAIPEIALFSATPNPVEVNVSVTVLAEVSGGVSPYRYSYGGLPPGCLQNNSPTFTCAPTTAGTYNLTLTVTDVHGHASEAVFELTVLPNTSSPPPPLFLLGQTMFTWIILFLIVGVTVVGAILLALRRRNTEPETDEDTESPYFARSGEASPYFERSGTFPRS